MTKIEALELELKARKMVEGTELNWYNVIRHTTSKAALLWPLAYYYSTEVEITDYELALGIVEGKAVWVGDKLWTTENALHTITHHINNISEWSWNPPKPKTVMVELTVADAEQISISEYTDSKYYVYARLATACRIALEKLNHD